MGEASKNEADARTERAMAKAAALGRAKRAESRAALALISTFVNDANAAGIATTRLKARSYNGESRYSTNVTGWYIRKDRSIGVGDDGQFYVLSAPTSLLARFRGVNISPSDPPMELGRGARDGESIALADALTNRLDAGNDY